MRHKIPQPMTSPDGLSLDSRFVMRVAHSDCYSGDEGHHHRGSSTRTVPNVGILSFHPNFLRSYDVQRFYHGCSTFLPVFDAKTDTYDILHERSPFAVDCICMVAARVRDGGTFSKFLRAMAGADPFSARRQSKRDIP
jgi:hypothetical protein